MKNISLGQLGSLFRRRFQARHRPRNPARDWTAILLLGCIVAIAFVALSTWTYVRVSNGDYASTADAVPSTLTIDRNKLTDVLTKWQGRADEYKKALVQQPSLSDPRK